MPSIVCVCERRISFGQIPSPIKWLAISDEKFEKFAGNVDAEEVYRAMFPILKCQYCDRLHIFPNGFSAPSCIYKKEG